MLRRAVLTLSAIVCVAACSSGSSSASKSAGTPTTAATSSTTTTTIAAVPPPDLAKARIALARLATVDQPTDLAIRSGDSTLYVTEQVGRVRAIRDDQLVPTPVLDIRDLVSSGGERGLLGIAFSPDGSTMYLDYTNTNGDTRVVSYAVRTDGSLETGSRRELLAIPQPQANHNGGSLVVANDGSLFVGMGDGGSEGDQGPGHAPGGNGQSLNTLLGKILHIDPTTSSGPPYTVPDDSPFAHGGGRPEIWAYGLRNPWRFSFDRATNDLWIGDVGQNNWEEIDYVQGGNAAGFNFGWNIWEGAHRYRAGNAPNVTMPIDEYPHSSTACAITGGYVYRGTRIPDLVGAYLYGDYCGSGIQALTQANGKVTTRRDFPLDVHQVVSFGEDGAGELYVLSQQGGVYRIDPA